MNNEWIENVRARLKEYEVAIDSIKECKLESLKIAIEKWCIMDLKHSINKITEPQPSKPIKENTDWISVKKKMPKNEVDVLVAFDDGFISTVNTNKEGEWKLWADSGEPTHWMPLPELPAEYK